jgi:hypothetical protein
MMKRFPGTDIKGSKVFSLLPEIAVEEFLVSFGPLP